MAEGAHPVRDRSESGVARADNALVLDPRRIVRRGLYVRPFTDDRRFRDLITAIAEAGNTIHVPVLVRVEGPPGAVEYVLVDGTHRLEAALRLNIPVPAVNLGRVTPEQAFAIQAMANEVRASMHVVDQAAYVLTLLGQGLNRETVQRTTGFSAGRVSELARIGALLATLSEEERAQARAAATVTHRALRAVAASGSPEAFQRQLGSLISASAGLDDLESLGDEIPVSSTALGVATPGDALVSNGYQSSHESAPRGRRGRTAHGAGGLSFAVGRNRRGTSVTFRMAWRARAVQADPELFLERVREALQAIATEATAHYDLANARMRKRQGRGRSATVGPRNWHDAIARDEAELGPRASAAADRPAQHDDATSGMIPDDDNPMPVPPSRRRPSDARQEISPRLLAGLSLPMLAERLKRRAPDYQQLDSHLTDVERQAEEARQRAREVLDRTGASRQVERGEEKGERR
jgi:ParB-like chromosome segregation protein Spo0J